MPSANPPTVGEQGLALIGSEQSMAHYVLLVPDTSVSAVREGRQRQRWVTPTRRERQKRQRDAWEFPGLTAVLCCSSTLLSLGAFFINTCSTPPHLEHHPTSRPAAHTSHIMSHARPRPHPPAPSSPDSHSRALPSDGMLPGFGVA